MSDVRYWALSGQSNVAFDVAFGGKADMGWCNANVCFQYPPAQIDTRGVSGATIGIDGIKFEAECCGL
jgi:hypothetical protein